MKSAVFLVWTGFVVVLIGTILPWARVRSHMQRVEFHEAGASGYQESSVGGFSIRGYSTSASLAGLTFPGWCIEVAALGCAILVTTGVVPALAWMLSVYGLLHVGFTAIALSGTPHMSPSVGILIVGVGSAVQIVGLIRTRRSSTDGQSINSSMSTGR